MVGSVARAAWRLAAILVAALACMAAVPRAASAQCGDTVSRTARHPGFAGQPPPLALGDSVLYDAADRLAGLGFDVNAMICRRIDQGMAWLRARANRLPRLVVLALGTNGPITQADIGAILRILGRRRVLAMVTPHHGDYGYVPGVIRAAARRYRGRIVLLDWDRYSARHPEWFAPDGTHLGGAAGINAYAHLIAPTLPLAAVPCP